MKKKKLLALLLTLAMLVSLLPMAVLPAAAAGTTEVNSWDQLAAALAQGGDITLATDIEAPAGSKPLGVLAGVSATLDLNGKIINAKGQLADAPAITVNGSLTLEDTKDLGWITGASVGVYVIGNDAGTGTFTMNGGDIYNNNVGVAVYGGRFIMNGGYIDGNEREQYNKSLIGVYAVGSDTVFTMNDGDINCNTAVGVYVSGGDFTMNDGQIDYNGIGIFAPDADFTVSGGYIYDNAIGVFAGGGDFDMEGGTIFHNDYVGVLMGIGPEELGLDKTLSIDTALSETVNGDIMSVLFTENPARAGGYFYMSGDAAVEENGIMNVLVAGAYTEGEGYNAALYMYDDAAVRATLSNPEIAAELDDDEAWTQDQKFKLRVKPMLGVIAIDADVTMEDNAGIYGSFTEEEEEESGKNKWYLPDSIDLGAFISNGTLSMSDSAEISGNSTIGVAGGYVIDAIAKLTKEELKFERRGTEIVMSDNAAIKNSGVLGVLLYGYDSEAEENLATLTMSGTSGIRGGESAFLEIPVGEEGDPIEKIPGAEKPFDIHLHPQFGLAAVGADVTMEDYATISAQFAPFIQKDDHNGYDITLQLGAVMCDGELKMSGASGITGNNIGGVLMGYPDDLVNLVLDRFEESENGNEVQDKEKPTPKDIIKAILLSNKHGNAINMKGSAAISGNGLFGAFTVGAGKEDYAKITMNGGSVVGNMVTGFAGVKTAYDLKNATIGKSLMGVLALLHSELDIGTGTAITDNTVGAAAIAASTITLNGGTVNNNTKPFTVEIEGEDSIDQLMMLTGDLTTLPGVISEYVKNGIGVLRLVLSGQIDEETAAPIAYAINGISGSDYMTANDVTWAIDLLNYGLENSQQTGIVVETLTSALNVKSGEIKGNTHGVSAFTVNSNLLKKIGDGIGQLLAPYSETAGITLDGSFTLKGNTKSDVDLMSISVNAGKMNFDPEAPVISVGTLPEDSAIRTGVYQLLVKQVAEDNIKPAGEKPSTLEKILCTVAKVLHNARVTIDPLPDVPFTKGLESEAEHFLSAIDGYVVALDAKTETEAILHAGEVEMTLTDNQGDVEDGKQISMNSGSQHQINATVTGAPELFYSVGDESIVGVALAETGDGTWTITLTGKSAGTTEVTIYTDGGQKVSLTVSVSAPGGGGFGGGSKVYKITVAETENGTATASKTTAAEGEKITVTAKPADGYVLESITVKGEKAGNVEVKDGVFVMPADDVTVTVKFKKADAKQTFTDVKPGDWFYEGVEYVAAKGIMQGPGGGVFQPNETTTRAMVAQVIWNMAGKPVVNAAIPFADVAEGAWYADAVRWAAEKGIVTGWTEADGRQVFDPEGKVTREQFSAMLYRYAKTLGKGFTGMWSFKLDFPDAGDVSDWAMEAMSWMVMQGIINGMDGKLNPKGFSTRAQIATMLQRFDTLA